MNQDDTLAHGAWKKHKYIRKEGKKYIYKESTKHDDGTVWDKYVAEDGSAIHKQAGYKYDPERPDYRKGVIDKAKEVASKITDKEDSNGEMAKGDYVDEEEKKKKYFVKHSDDSLAHSLRGSQRANHKYSARKWVNGKWRYFYGKIPNVITGSKFKEGDKQWREAAKAEDDRANFYKKEILNPAYEAKDENWKQLARTAIRGANNNALKYRKTAADYRERYRTETLAGITESAVNKGRKALSDFFKNSSKTKVTVKDTFTGETRTPKQTGNDVINIKELSEKNKKKNSNKKVKYLKDGSKVTIETSTYSRRSR